MKLLILSDIHGNLSAMNAVLDYLQNVQIDSMAILGDLIDYCPHSNEVIKIISNMNIPVISNIWGNHEDAILNEHFDRFSSPRGVESAKYTKSLLDQFSLSYLNSKMEKNGTQEFLIDNKKFLVVHGTIEDKYWGKFDVKKDLTPYSEYDYVLMGHSHRPVYYEAFFECDNPITRNQKKTIFINPGSVGQPRNLNPNSQFAILDTESGSCDFIKLPYDIAKEQKDFSDNVDKFYKTRLEAGV
jgi:putative phosphoesterase